MTLWMSGLLVNAFIPLCARWQERDKHWQMHANRPRPTGVRSPLPPAIAALPSSPRRAAAAGRQSLFLPTMTTTTADTAQPAHLATPVAPVASATATATPPLQAAAPHQGFLLPIVGGAAFAHLLNDMIQAMLPSIFPMLKANFSLSFGQIGIIALVYQVTASLLQPWIGFYTDKHPKPYLLPAGMCMTLLGIALLAMAHSYPMLLVAAAVVGVGSATFHPEASRIARLGSGGRFGTAQSTFQVGGNTGTAIGPLLTAAIVIPHGQPAVAWFMVAALLAIFVLYRLTTWVRHHGAAKARGLARGGSEGLDRAGVVRAVAVICVLMFAKFVYIASFTY